jgi:hypothetical protein
MPKQGDELGADLGELWYAGNHDLPLVASDYTAAQIGVPLSTAPMTSRGGGLGVDPGGLIDSYASYVHKMLADTHDAVSDVATALVWIADEYAATDASCKQAFDAKKAYLEANGDQP